MCTVTYIPAPGGPFLTSSRDEQRTRPPALEPGYYAGDTGRLLFPKDPRAGGTWFAAHGIGHVAVLLNGAWQRHTSRPPYRRSRGLVLVELTDQADPLQAFHSMDLEGIEPFTLILVEERLLHECRWDGTTKFHRAPDPTLPHIWSSVTLYKPDVIRKKEQWFHTWLQDHPPPSVEDVLNFHHFTDSGDPHNSILMNRDDQTLTVSITLIHHQHQHVNTAPMHMHYLDIPGGKTFHSILLTPATSPAV